jgi:hypothetical protein
MEVKTKTYYTCKICGKTSTVEEKIKQCESSHLTIDADTTIEPDYARGKSYPIGFWVIKDGMRYYYDYRFCRKDEATK